MGLRLATSTLTPARRSDARSDFRVLAQGAATELRMINQQDRFHCAFGNDLFDAECRDGRLVSPVGRLKTFRTQNGLLDKECFCHLFGLRSDER
jgi:hypothetical protein